MIDKPTIKVRRLEVDETPNSLTNLCLHQSEVSYATSRFLRR